MKLIPKYQGGNKTYQYRRFGDINLPANIKILDKSGLELSPDSDPMILTDNNGRPINRDWLVANNYHYSPSPDTVYANTPLNGVEVVATKKKKPNLANSTKQFIDNEILLNKAGIRTANYNRALSKNPNFSQDWDMANNIYNFVNTASYGLANRFSPTQNVGLVIDAAKGKDVLNSWMGNSGIVSDKFNQEHPIASMLINGAGDAGAYVFRPKLLPNTSAPVIEGSTNITPSFRTYPLADSWKFQRARWRNFAKERFKADAESLPPLTEKEQKVFDKVLALQKEYPGDIMAPEHLTKDELNTVIDMNDRGYFNWFAKNQIIPKLHTTSHPYYQGNAVARAPFRVFIEGEDRDFLNNIATRMHEYDHMVHSPAKMIPIDAVIDPFSDGSPVNFKVWEYLFNGRNGTESAARMSQLKNYFGITDDAPITPEMFEYAKKHYIADTGYDNNMKEWFESITDIPKFLKWANRYSWAIAPTAVGTQLTDNNKNKQQ